MKKLICLLLACVTLLSASMVGVSADYFLEDLPFDDVKQGAWYYDAISLCYYSQIVKGMSDTKFEPAGTLTRAQFVQILAKMSSEDFESYKNKNSGFDDVKKGHWYNAPVCWAVDKGLVKGLSETTFGPNEPITREQLARLFYLFVDYIGMDVKKSADLSGYEDSKSISKWAYAEMQWAVAAGLISGTSETTLEPRNVATRAQACQMISNLTQFLMFGYEETSPVFNAIVDYIMAKGELSSDDTVYTLTKNGKGYDLVLEYDTSLKTVYISYLAEPYKYREDGEIYTDHREQANMYISSLASEYSLDYYYEDANSEDYTFAYATMDVDGCSNVDGDYEIYTKEELSAKFEKISGIMRNYISAILKKAGFTLEDLFLPKEGLDAVDVKAELAAYICLNGEMSDDMSSIVLYKDNGDNAYVAEYDAENDELCFVYVSEPIPGGKDIFDTNYREKAILSFTTADGDNCFTYEYESKGGEKFISVSGNTNGIKHDYDLEDYTGFTKKAAQSKINSALDKVMNYYYELLETVTAE